MKYIDRAKIVIVLSLAGLSAAGCYDKKDQEIRILHGNIQQLQRDKTDLGTKLAAAREKEAEMVALLDSKDGQLVASATRIKGLEDRVIELEKKPNGDKVVKTLPPGREEKWTLSSDVLFGPGQATLTIAGRRELNRVINTINRDHRGRSIRVYGHTDSDPIVRSKKKWRDNLQLSGARAAEVKNYMVAKGIPEEGIGTIPMGSSNPVASNSTRAGKQRNRRVEIEVTRK